MKNTWLIKDQQELVGFSEQLVDFLRSLASQKIDPENQSAIVTLTGDLGAGKTTLTQHIARALGVTEKVSSPTFVIAKYYDLYPSRGPTSRNNYRGTTSLCPWQRLIHIDAYRLEGEPLEPMGFDELFADPSNVIVIEWPEYVKPILPNSHTNITISINKDESRNIKIH